MADSIGASASQTGLSQQAAEPEVSALRASIPSVDRGPEWAEMEARHAREGVTRWHAERMPGVTDEQLAAEMNETARYLSIPENNVASRLRGEAFILRDSAACTLNSREFKDGEFVSVEVPPLQRGKARGQQQLADLLIEAAVLLESHTQGMETRQGGDGTAPSRSDDSPVGGHADAPNSSSQDTDHVA